MNYKTMWKDLEFTKIEEGCWMFLNEGHQVGPQYPTRELLIRDMPRYAKESWGLGDYVPMTAEFKQLRSDALRMALRLYGEDPDTFSPETREVMDRWRPICEEILSVDKCTCLSDHPDYCTIHAA